MQALWMVAGAFFFATMGVFVKQAAPYFTTAEVVFYRGLIGMAFVWALTRSQGVTLKTSHPWMHVWRSAVGVTAMGFWFYAIAHLPLATAMTFNYTSGLWMAAFLLVAALWSFRPSHQGARKPLNLPLLGTILLGFGGVILVLQPSFAQAQGLAASVGAISGVLSALAYLQVTALARVGEPESRTVFYYCLGCVVGGAAVMGVQGASPWPAGWAGLWLLPMGLFAVFGQLCMTRAYASASNARGTLVVANLQYSGLIFASAYSLFLFEDRITASAWLGMALVAASGIAATALRSRQAPSTPEPEAEAETAADVAAAAVTSTPAVSAVATSGNPR